MVRLVWVARQQDGSETHQGGCSGNIVLGKKEFRYTALCVAPGRISDGLWFVYRLASDSYSPLCLQPTRSLFISNSICILLYYVFFLPRIPTGLTLLAFWWHIQGSCWCSRWRRIVLRDAAPARIEDWAVITDSGSILHSRTSNLCGLIHVA